MNSELASFVFGGLLWLRRLRLVRTLAFQAGKAGSSPAGAAKRKKFMEELEKLKQALAAVKKKQSKLFKEKAASPKEIMAKANVYAEEIQALEERIREKENENT